MSNDDPTPELYAIMDRAGLDAARLLAARKPMSRIVNEIRTKMAQEIRTYIEQRENIKHIEVKEIEYE